MRLNTTGSSNTAIGTEALYNTTTGDHNTANGLKSLYSNTTGTGNTATGYSALDNNTTGSDNTAIGYEADVSSNNLSNATALGKGAIVTASNAIQLGNTSVTDVKTSGTITAGDVTYPKTHGTANQVLSTTGSGTLAWSTPAGGNLYQKTNNSTTLTSNVQNIISLSLPAGSYLVTYTGMAYKSGSGSEYVASRIAISQPSSNLGGQDAIMVTREVNDSRAYVVHQLGITLATAGSVSIWANNIYGTSNTILTNSRLTAVQVGAVIDQ
jgi:hypothetical protein